MRFLGIVPLLFFCALVLFLRSKAPGRDALILGGIITGLWVVAGCELLSWFHAVALWSLVVWWTVPVGILVWKCGKNRVLTSLPFEGGGKTDWILLAIIGAIAL